jgi:hypothetical protein
MEEQIKLMLSNSKIDLVGEYPYRLEINTDHAAKEITAHVFEFIEWVHNYCDETKYGWYCFYIDENTNDDFDYSKGFRYFGTNEELYQYWLTEVKK